MRALVLSTITLALAGSSAGWECGRQMTDDEALQAAGSELAGFEDFLRAGPPAIVVAGPKDEGAFLAGGSRWAAEEVASVLRADGFEALVRSSGDSGVTPVRQVDVVAAAPLDALARLAVDRGAEVIVFVALRSVEVRESGPRLLDWEYDGAIEVLEPKTGRGISWAATGSARAETANDVPADPEAAVRPLAVKWARKALLRARFGLVSLPGGDA